MGRAFGQWAGWTAAGPLPGRDGLQGPPLTRGEPAL
jgi:hypothetical protein